MKQSDKDNEDEDDIWIEVMEMQDTILEPYFTWEKIKCDLESYYLSGACHAYAPTFELTLARLVEPEETWRVQASNVHSTVINKDNTKVFDLLYWADHHRLNNHVFGDKINKKNIDLTLGGKDAYVDSLNDRDDVDL